MATKEITTKQQLKQKVMAHLARGEKLGALAERVGVSRWKLYKWTKGTRHILDIDDAVKIAEGLGYTLKLEKK